MPRPIRPADGPSHRPAPPYVVLNADNEDTIPANEYKFSTDGEGVRHDLVRAVADAWSRLAPGGDTAALLREAGRSPLSTVYLAEVAVEAILNIGGPPARWEAGLTTAVLTSWCTMAHSTDPADALRQIDQAVIFQFNAWCLTTQGTVADATLPDGQAHLYLGLPLSQSFRRNEQARRSTSAVITHDPRNLLAGVNDQAERLAAGRRRRRIEAVPDSLRPAVSAFDVSRMRAQDRARRAGTRPRSDHTLETALATMRDLALFLLAEKDKDDWSLVDVHDIEAFLATLPKARKRRLTVLRQFFRFARAQKLVLVDPTRTLAVKEANGFRGRTLTLDQQRQLFRRWTTDERVHPHEALVGMLALLHGASSSEARMLQIDGINDSARTVRLGKRPHPVPLDPASWTVLQRCLTHRASWRTDNPHVMVTKGTKAGQSAASTAYLSHVLDDCGFPPRMIRSTRLVDLVNTLDPKLVAAAFGMDPQATLIYLSDHIDETRMSGWNVSRT
ncbi:tyrosine-type recombinase/integrase [Kitasatospora sp. NPDC088160]|uniref:tyrosine-type recombinase/integrase n=1 Tax=Kitasatospora sp. NPDC088160 TaxID=3364072 RepID=UPI00382C1A71